jgi:hypothetical protein
LTRYQKYYDQISSSRAELVLEEDEKIQTVVQCIKKYARNRGVRLRISTEVRNDGRKIIHVREKKR